MKLIEVVILAGTHCISPMQGVDGVTEVTKVPCAVMVRHDAATDDVEFVPPSAATNPEVISMLVRSRGSEPVRAAEMELNTDEMQIEPAAASERQVALPVATPRKKPLRSASATPVKEKARARVASAEPRRQKASGRKLADKCGSYRAVWYTAKGGHKKYRCVKTG